jgi:hypothetical protein
MFLQLMAAAALTGAPPQPAGPRIAPVGFNETRIVADTPALADTVPRKRKRPRAIEYSDAYYTRLRIHQIASYAELPMFALEWTLGERLLKRSAAAGAVGGESESDGLKGAHTTVALGLGALFTINTITGGWNLWESRHDPAGRTLRIIHSVTMLGADAGFALAGATAPGDDGGSNASRHRTIALSSMGLATASTLMMWLFHD